MHEILSICKGGGYLYCRTSPVHPKANSKGLYPLHRVIVENRIGRLLSSREDVHHRDHNRMNNDPENLEVLTRSEHGKRHHPSIDSQTLHCGWCNKEVFLKPSHLKTRLERTKSGKVFCSRSCGAKHQFQTVK